MKSIVFLILFVALPVYCLYNSSLSSLILNYAAISYCPESQIKSWSCSRCLDSRIQDLVYFKNQNTSVVGFFGYDPDLKVWILSFEGTQDLTDWYYDLQYSQLIPYKIHPYAKVHKGFWTAYKSISETILEIIKSSGISEKDQIIVTGHSLGAAMATLASLDLIEEGVITHAQIYVYTYGSPRVGNHYYSSLYNTYVDTHYRVTHDHDPVVHVPLASQSGYEHVASEVYYYQQDTLAYRECPEPESPICADSVKISLNVHDHRWYLREKVTEC